MEREKNLVPETKTGIGFGKIWFPVLVLKTLFWSYPKFTFGSDYWKIYSFTASIKHGIKINWMQFQLNHN